MIPRLEELALDVGKSISERELAHVLREQTEAERLQFIQELIASKRPKSLRIGLRLVKSCLQDRSSLLQILDQGLREADASNVADWIDAVVPGLGFKRVVGLLADRVNTVPESVIKARYWLPKWIPENDSSAIEVMQALDRQIAEEIQGNARLEALFQSVRGE